MSLRLLAGLGGGLRVISLSVTSSENDFVLYNELDSAGHNPSGPTKPGGRTIIKVSLSSSVIIGSTSTSTAAFRTHDGDTYGTGWAAADCQIIVASGTATIQGKGGAGGAGYAGVPGIDDSTGGGGGGGAGTQVGAGGLGPGDATDGNAGTQSGGGTGGSGALTGSPDPSAAVAGGNGGVALEASSGGPNVTLRPASGATVRVWGGGAGGGGGGTNGAGGSGGNPGADGSAGSGGGAAAGGTHGSAYSTPGSATITEVGPGTIDDLGA